MKRGDRWLALVLLLIVGAFLLPRFLDKEPESELKNKRVEIMVDGELYRSVEFTSEKQTIKIETERGYNIVEIGPDDIYMIDADCSDKVCVLSGHVHEVNRPIVCLPNRVFIQIVDVSGEGDGLDAVVS